MLFRGSYKGSLVTFSFSDLKGFEDEKVSVRGQIPLDEITEISSSVGKDKNDNFIFVGDVLEAPFGFFRVIEPDKEARQTVHCQSEGGKVGVFAEYCKVIGNDFETPGLFEIKCLLAV